MYEVETKFGSSAMDLKTKIRNFALIHGVSEETIRTMYASTYDTQMTELSKWQYINSCLYKQKGVI